MTTLALRRPTGLYLGLLSLVLALGLTSLNSGPLGHDLSVLVSAILSDEPSLMSETFWQLRLPRVVLALLVGATLAVAGVTMQAIFRNPLAEPGLTGASSGAALAAACVVC